MAAKKRTSEEKIARAALHLRDKCLEEMRMSAGDVETFGDPGDAVVCIQGNDKNANSVLYILRAIGVPGCTFNV